MNERFRLRGYLPAVGMLPLGMLMTYLTYHADATPGVIGVPTWRFVFWSAMAGLSPAVFLAVALRLSYDRPIGRGMSRRGIAVHAIGASLATLFDRLWAVYLERTSQLPIEVMSLIPAIIGSFVMYVALVAVIQGVRNARASREGETRRLRLRAELTQAGRRRAMAELRALKAELNPHFLGNALQSVKGLMRTDVAAADRVLVQLGHLLRSTSARAETAESTLAEEIESLEPFLEVERARLRGRFVVETDAAVETLDVLVPDMILQPLVENAVKHGLAPLGGGRVRITARAAAGDMLVLSVEDNGVSLGAVGTSRASATGGIGLSNIRSRLAQLHGSRATLDLGRGGIGTIVRVALPWRSALTTSDDDVLEAPEREEIATAVRLADEQPARSPFMRIARSALRIGATVAFWSWTASRSIEANIVHAARLGFDVNSPYMRTDAILLATFATLLVWTAILAADRWPWRRWEGRMREHPVAKYLLLGVMFGLGLAALEYALLALYHYEPLRSRSITPNVIRILVGSISEFAMFTFLANVVMGVVKHRRSEAAAWRLTAAIETTRRRQIEAELRALKAELNPHFVGNALQAVSTLMRTNPEGAEDVIDQLGDLLRSAVSRAGTQEVTLQEELDTLEQFLSVERVRLGHHLAVRWNVDADTLRGRVPHMILQPLVENAVKHGLVPRNGGGLIELSARHAGEMLELVVHDDGVGSAGPVDVQRPTRAGIGLANARSRLSELYGATASLELVIGGSGTSARLTIPWHADAATPAPASDVGA